MPLTLASIARRAACSRCSQWGDAATGTTTFHGHAGARSLRHRLQLHLPRRRGADGAAGAGASCASTSFEFGEFYSLLLFATVGHDDPRRRRPTSSPSSSASRRCRSRSTCSPARGATRRRASEARDEVLPGRRVRHGDPALRHGAHLRRRRARRRWPRSRASAPRVLAGSRCSSSASCSCSSRSASRSRRCRFTCGRPMPTKARRRR